MVIQSQQSHYNSCLAMMSTICFPLGETFPSKKVYCCTLKRTSMVHILNNKQCKSVILMLKIHFVLITNAAEQLHNATFKAFCCVFPKICKKTLQLHCLFLVSLIRSQNFHYHNFLTRYNSSISQHILSLIKRTLSTVVNFI